MAPSIGPVHGGQSPRVDLENVDVEEALDVAGVGKYNYMLLFACCITHLGGVMDMLGYSLVVPAASCDLQLTLKQRSLLTSVSFAGFMFALPWGYFADTRGRRKALLLSCSVGFIVTGLSSFSISFYDMLVLKFLGCSFSTASLTLTITYLGECTPKRHRSKYLLIQNCYCLAADLVCFVLAYIFLPMDIQLQIPLLTTYRPWRLLTLVLSVPLGIGAIMVCFLEESPKFLANIGETEKAMEVLRTTYNINMGNMKEYPIKSLKKAYKPEESISFWRSVMRQTVPVFRPPLLWRSFQLFFILAICCSTNNVFFMWFPTLVNSFFSSTESGGTTEGISFCEKIVANITPEYDDNVSCTNQTPLNTIYAGMLFTLVFTALNVAVIGLAAWRKTILISMFLVSGACCILVDIVHHPVASMVLFFMIQFTGLCIGTVGSFFVDIFPTSYRGLATSLGMMAARFTCLGGVNLVGATIIDHCRLTFYCWAIFVFGGVLAVLFLPSEIKSDGQPGEDKIHVTETIQTHL